jgi:MoxR-like ATPase
MVIRDRIENVLSGLGDGLYERDEAIRLALLAALSGESVFMLGPPGVAKSLVARRLKCAFKDARVFEYLMNRFSTPDEIFGPISIKQLKDEDKYQRLTKEYMPGAQIVFLDEIWKAGPSIQNTLLTIINEKVYRNGAQEDQVDLRGLIAASNELPAKGEGLEALWDRFLVRLMVEGIEDSESFNAMLTEQHDLYDDTVPETAKLSDEDYQECQTLAKLVEVPDYVLAVIHAIRSELVKADEQDGQKVDWYVSDRRWKKVVHMLRTSAYLNGREHVDLMDCVLIKYCIWNDESQLEHVEKIVRTTLRNHGYSLPFDLDSIRDEIMRLKKDVEKETTHEVAEGTKAVFNPDQDGDVEFSPRCDMNYEQYCYIKLADFNSIRIGGNGNVELIDSNQNTHRCSILRVKESAFRLNNARINSQLHRITHSTKPVLVTKYRAPHAAVCKEWDKAAKKIQIQLSNMITQLDLYRKNELASLRTNLFVDPEWGDVIEEHLKESREELESVKVEIMQIQHSYADKSSTKGTTKKLNSPDDELTENKIAVSR